MKNKSIKGLAFIAVAGTFVSSCDLMKDLEYKVTPNPLEMHGDSVRVKVDVTFPEKGLKKKASAEVTPMLGNTALKSVTFLGEKATGNGTTIMYKPGGKYTYTDVVAYKPEMENADLTVSGKVMKGLKEKDQLGPIKIADATIITPLLVRKDFKVVMEKDNFQRVTPQMTSAQINFDKAKSNLKAAELKDADIKALEAWLAAAQTNTRIAIKSVNVVGYASPEGEEDKNNTLSTDRAATAKEAGLKMVKKAKNTVVNADMIVTSGKGEDWAGFKAALAKSTEMNEDEKQLVIRVLEMYKDPVQREQEMRNMAKTFTYLEKNILPQLRRAELIVNYDLTGYTDAELVALSKSSIDSLDVEEILFTATLTQDLDEKLRLYNEASRLYPTDHRAFNNAGAILYMKNSMDEAKAKFEKANTLKDNAIAKNNLAAVAGVKGDRKKAKELLAQAKGAGSEVNYNMGILYIQDGKYADAVSNLGDNNFNKALAQLLNGNAGACTTTLDASADKETAMGYYLKAVAAARQDNLANIVSNLKNAISKDASLKSKAAKDREFIKYAENASFTAVAN